jgi:hypothetical protein
MGTFGRKMDIKHMHGLFSSDKITVNFTRINNEYSLEKVIKSLTNDKQSGLYIEGDTSIFSRVLHEVELRFSTNNFLMCCGHSLKIKTLDSNLELKIPYLSNDETIVEVNDDCRILFYFRMPYEMFHVNDQGVKKHFSSNYSENVISMGIEPKRRNIYCYKFNKEPE